MSLEPECGIGLSQARYSPLTHCFMPPWLLTDTNLQGCFMTVRKLFCSLERLAGSGSGHLAMCHDNIRGLMSQEPGWTLAATWMLCDPGDACYPP